MVMTLRKRGGRRSPSPALSSSSSDGETNSRRTRSQSQSRGIKQNPKPKSASAYTRKKTTTATTYINTSSDSDSDSGSDPNEYEKVREQRMKENKERMLKLGIFSLASQLHPPTKRPPLKRKRNPPLYPCSRSSSRVPRSGGNGKYFETQRSLLDMGITIPDSWTPEVYTEQDEMLLGNCKTEWTLNVDGFGEDGDPLYDPLNGTSCHQCRQKTIRKHTFCFKCRLPHGQICGDCLYTRYGENVVETMENPEWGCPACRGICNCSRCRRAKGWPPVNILYAKVNESGYKSVAHFLIGTRCGGAITKEPEEETEAPLRYQGSDTSAEWSDSDDSDDSADSKTRKKKVVENVVATAESCSEPTAAAAADKNQGLATAHSAIC